MKNVQVIDAGDNCAYNVYKISDEDFDIMFPNGQDIEFIEDFWKRLGHKRAREIRDRLNSGLISKSQINGIHGTLFIEYKREKKRFYPNKKFSDDPASAY